MSKQNIAHAPVLLTEVLEVLAPKIDESYLDVTAGFGGHAKAVLKLTKKPESAVLIDRDSEAVSALKEQPGFNGAEILQKDYLDASESLAATGRRFDMILADLGVSSYQLLSADRGFSIKNPGPLDMRMDQDQGMKATDILNRLSQDEMAKIFANFGGEPKANKIAKLVVENRPIVSTDQLAALATKAWPGYRRIHPATRIFQAVRIAVNDELTQLEQSLPIWLELLNPEGRLVVISFHSLEDRIVKSFFSEHSAEKYDGELKILTKKPISASENEIVSNPRARSAKLRAAAKIKTKRKV